MVIFFSPIIIFQLFISFFIKNVDCFKVIYAVVSRKFTGNLITDIIYFLTTIYITFIFVSFLESNVIK